MGLCFVNKCCSSRQRLEHHFWDKFRTILGPKCSLNGTQTGPKTIPNKSQQRIHDVSSIFGAPRGLGHRLAAPQRIQMPWGGTPQKKSKKKQVT